MRRRALLASLVGMTAASCGGAASAPQEPRAPSAQEWRDARASLTELRGRWAGRTGTQRVGVRFNFGEVEVEGRGAVAVRLPDALRMQIIGPGGLTAMDLLVVGAQWRLALPQREQVMRGEAAGEVGERGLPVGFLRWWLLHPLEGRLLSAAKGKNGWEWVLRDGDAVVEVREGVGSGLELERRSMWGHERVRAWGPGCGTVHYEHREAGVRVEVRCEGNTEGTPHSAAFEDPDARRAGEVSDP